MGAHSLLTPKQQRLVALLQQLRADAVNRKHFETSLGTTAQTALHAFENLQRLLSVGAVAVAGDIVAQVEAHAALFPTTDADAGADGDAAGAGGPSGRSPLLQGLVQELEEIKGFVGDHLVPAESEERRRYAAAAQAFERGMAHCPLPVPESVLDANGVCKQGVVAVDGRADDMVSMFRAFAERAPKFVAAMAGAEEEFVGAYVRDQELGNPALLEGEKSKARKAMAGHLVELLEALQVRVQSPCCPSCPRQPPPASAVTSPCAPVASSPRLFLPDCFPLQLVREKESDRQAAYDGASTESLANHDDLIALIDDEIAAVEGGAGPAGVEDMQKMLEKLLADIDEMKRQGVRTRRGGHDDDDDDDDGRSARRSRDADDAASDVATDRDAAAAAAAADDDEDLALTRSERQDLLDDPNLSDSARKYLQEASHGALEADDDADADGKVVPSAPRDRRAMSMATEQRIEEAVEEAAAVREALAEVRLTAIEEELQQLEADAPVAAAEEQQTKILEQISDQVQQGVDAVIEAERKKQEEMLKALENLTAPTETAETEEEDEEARRRRDLEEEELLKKRFEQEREQKLKSLMRTQSQFMSSSMLADTSEEAKKERAVAALVNSRFTVARRLRAMDNRVAFKAQQAEYAQRRLSLPQEGSDERAAAVAALDAAEGAALEQLCASLLAAETQHEDGEDVEAQRLTGDSASVDLDAEVARLREQAAARLAEVRKRHAALAQQRRATAAAEQQAEAAAAEAAVAARKQVSLADGFPPLDAETEAAMRAEAQAVGAAAVARVATELDEDDRVLAGDVAQLEEILEIPVAWGPKIDYRAMQTQLHERVVEELHRELDMEVGTTGRMPPHPHHPHRTRISCSFSIPSLPLPPPPDAPRDVRVRASGRGQADAGIDGPAAPPRRPRGG